MKILVYNDLHYGKLKDKFDKVCVMLERGDFKSADVKKLYPGCYYRAKLDDTNRLLFRFGRFGDETCLLLLEIIFNHAYDKSRFLGGSVVDENKLSSLHQDSKVPNEDKVEIKYINPANRYFHVLDKILSFDDVQSEVFKIRPPVIVIGSAGSGKTVLTLEKMKTLTGSILYVTRSPFLTENARELYYASGYWNDSQEVDFLSFDELLGSIALPPGREMGYSKFVKWFQPFRNTVKIRDSHKLYEEIKGVLTGMAVDKPHLEPEEYLGLGVKQSIFPEAERAEVYDIFQKYLKAVLKGDDWHDVNIVSYGHLKKVSPTYDFVVVDEVQDLTNIQIQLILKGLKNPGDFILCGDSNQIVHPNFFSWSRVKTMFYEQPCKQTSKEIIRILHTNYRNSPEITEMANRLLLIKNARFGSIDRESNYLVTSCSRSSGIIEFLEDSPKVRNELNSRTAQSAKFAVLVPRDEDKEHAAAFFKTPLLFSIHEAKGLEYDNIILYNFISGNSREFADIASGLTDADLKKDLKYSRAKDKADKSLEAYKFYINSLYVAVTRGIKNLHVLEKNQGHPLLRLLNLVEQKQTTSARGQKSTSDEWREEARRLELQGKQEHADRIRRELLGNQPVAWQVVDAGSLEQLKAEALDPKNFNKQAKLLLSEFAVTYDLTEMLSDLLLLKYSRAARPDMILQETERKYSQMFRERSYHTLMHYTQRHGVDFRNRINQTPLMLAAKIGDAELIRKLLEMGADRNLMDSQGRSALHVAIREAFFNKNYAATKLAEIYPLLEPQSISLRVADRLVKLDNHTMHFFLVNAMLALTVNILKSRGPMLKRGFGAPDFAFALEFFPDRVIPEYRSKRQYISSILSGAEMFRNADTGRQRPVFWRLSRGYYLLNPKMDILVNKEWVNVYKLMNVEAYCLEHGGDRTSRELMELIADPRPHEEASAAMTAKIIRELMPEKHTKDIHQPDLFETLDKHNRIK